MARTKGLFASAAAAVLLPPMSEKRPERVRTNRHLQPETGQFIGSNRN
jgi:hypothetical protein